MRGRRDSQDPRVHGPRHAPYVQVYRPSGIRLLLLSCDAEWLASPNASCVCSQAFLGCAHTIALCVCLSALYLVEGPAGGRCETCRRCEVISVHAGCPMTMISAARVHRCAPGQVEVQYTMLRCGCDTRVLLCSPAAPDTGILRAARSAPDLRSYSRTPKYSSLRERRDEKEGRNEKEAAAWKLELW